MSAPTLSPEQIQITINNLKAITIELQNLLINLQPAPVAPVVEPVVEPVAKVFTKNVLLTKQIVLHANRTKVVWDYDLDSEVPEGCTYVELDNAPNLLQTYKIHTVTYDPNTNTITYDSNITDDTVVIIPKGTVIAILSYKKNVV